MRSIPFPTGVFSCLLLSAAFSSARADEAIKTGQFDLNASTGLVYLMQDFKDGQYTKFSSNTPMIAAGVEMGLSDNWSFGIGPTFSSGFESDYKDAYNDVSKSMSAWGFLTDTKVYLPNAFFGITPYGRLDVGFHVWTWEQTRNTVVSHSSGFTTSYGLHGGGKYNISDRFYAFAEAGYGWTLVNAGIAFRIFEN